MWQVQLLLAQRTSKFASERVVEAAGALGWYLSSAVQQQKLVLLDLASQLACLSHLSHSLQMNGSFEVEFVAEVLVVLQRLVVERLGEVLAELLLDLVQAQLLLVLEIV